MDACTEWTKVDFEQAWVLTQAHPLDPNVFRAGVQRLFFAAMQLKGPMETDRWSVDATRAPYHESPDDHATLTVMRLRDEDTVEAALDRSSKTITFDQLPHEFQIVGTKNRALGLLFLPPEAKKKEDQDALDRREFTHIACNLVQWWTRVTLGADGPDIGKHIRARMRA